jgi:hypothetical protein
MASFTVDAINAAKQNEADDTEQRKNAASTSKLLLRSVIKQSEQNSKKKDQAQERRLKLEEARIVKILQIKIQRRFDAFPFLCDRLPKITKSASIFELQELDEAQKLELDLQGAEKRLKTYLKHGSVSLEQFWGDGRKLTFLPEKLRLDLTGFGAVFNSPAFAKEIEPLITETVIEYPMFGAAPLWMRWVEAFVGAMFAVNNMNKDADKKKVLAKGMVPLDELEDDDEDESEETAASAAAKSK